MLNKKIIKILIGTNNPGKLKEIKELMPNFLKIYSTMDFKIKSPVENGSSFLANSLIKARHFSKKTKMICLADDSGLEVDILNGAPGIYSSRWGGPKWARRGREWASTHPWARSATGRIRRM